MSSKPNTRTTAGLPTKRLALLALVTIAALALALSGAVAADNETANESTLIHDFDESDVRLTKVAFHDGRAYVTLESESRETVTISDAGASSHGQFAVTTTRFSGTEVIEIPLQDDEAVAVSTPQDGYIYTGDVGLLTVIQNEPTTVLIQWAAIAGTIGPLIALSLVVTTLRRNHENTYKELTSEERIKVEKDPVDGFVDKTKRFVVENRTLILLISGLTFYMTFWIAGLVPGPRGLWAGMSDAMRIIAVGSLLTLLISLVPVYLLARRLWNPQKEFVFSCDARDVIEEALGADGGLAEMVEAVEEMSEQDDRDEDHGLAIYSGSPERISDMTIDGAATDSRAPGGPCHFVQSFNPRKNEAKGTWPGLADDLEIIADRSKIDGNREILRDESKMLRSLLSAMPAISISADTGAARAVDSELRNLLAVDGNPVDGILGRAAQGTRFEGFYDEDDGETVEYQDPDEDEQDDEKSETEAEQ